MQIQQAKNTINYQKIRVRLKQIPQKQKQYRNSKDLLYLHQNFEDSFTPWDILDNNRLLLPYPLKRTTKNNSISYSNPTPTQFLVTQQKKQKYYEKSLLQRKNHINNEKILKMSSLDMHLDQQVMYSPFKKYGMNENTNKQKNQKQVQKQMPNRVKALKKTLLKFEKQSGEEQNSKSKQKLMFSTCLTEKFSKDLVAETLTINSAIPNRDSMKCRKDNQKIKGQILPPLQEQQKSVRLQKNELFSKFAHKKLSLQLGSKKRQLKLKQFVMLQDFDTQKKSPQKLVSL